MGDPIKLLIDVNFTDVETCTLATQENIPFPRKYTWKYFGVKTHGVCILLSRTQKKIANNN